jgi:hypothetical protein
LFDKIFKILKFQRIGQKMFDPSAPLVIPQHKLEVWPGYVKSVEEQEGIFNFLTLLFNFLMNSILFNFRWHYAVFGR